ncbi:MAG: arsenite methyltransferase [Planctomycetota bacterium]|jgi:SAM-dependent methyltransferase
MSKAKEIRARVAKDYASAVTGSSCCGSSEGKGSAVRFAGYTGEQIGSLPEDAVTNAFGCGNPVALSRLEPGDVVVDLGSGAGIDILLAARKVGPTGRVIGVDMTDAMIERAKENIEASGLTNVEARKGVIEALPVESSSVDWVISNCVVNLSPEKPKVFAEIARVLKPGGQVMISDIVVEDLPQWVRDDPRLFSGCVAGAISEAEYVQGLKEAGLEEVEVTGRFVYEASQLTPALEAAEHEGSCTCCGDSAGDDHEGGRALAETLAGKVWSAGFLARKPR